MREIRQSGSEGGVAVTRHPYPYDGAWAKGKLLGFVAKMKNETDN